ncbi:MAG TPA: DEAD/DEAH box helicase family protein [Rectinemataceae bacterium]|nr:DEAD/DEAH box helicase family protein [Rectinemataceae bacterium]
MKNKKALSERDIVTQFIIPALVKAGWDLKRQVREEVYLTDGRIFVKGSATSRGERKRADIVLYRKPNLPIAVIEAKDNNHSLGSGLQQALGYATMLDLPTAISSNGDGFLDHDGSGSSQTIERELALDAFPSPDELWTRYKRFKGIESAKEERLADREYFFDGSGRAPRYYQQIAINRAVEAIAKGDRRILLVMATGTGKTYTAFQIIWRLWKAGAAKRILFLADRNSLIDQTKRGDFKHFKDRMTIIRKKKIDKAYEIYLALYQGITNYDENAIANGAGAAYRQFSPDFFDLIVVDECHRGSAAADSAWREILEYFASATQIGLTATPRETKTVSNSEYFGEPIYTYSLRQGIDDGFLAPYKVIRIGLNIDLEGWRPIAGMTDKDGKPVDDRVYNTRDFDRNIVIEDRTVAVARRVTEWLRLHDRFAKTIIFCVDIDHAERMRHALAVLNADLVLENWKYVMRITGDNDEGKRELDNFINPEERYPVIATTSKLMTTGVDAQTCKLIVLDANIASMTEFKQIIGRGTRIREDHDKTFFTIMDFRNVTELFADPTFDGDPVRVKRVLGDEPLEDDEGSDPTAIPAVATTATYPEDRGEGSDDKDFREKPVIAGVEVAILNTRIQTLDENGHLIFESLRAYTRKSLQAEYRSLDAFLARWNEAERKQAIIEELAAKGIVREDLRDECKRDLDLFDLLCHVAWGRPALTRRERAEDVKKRDYFAKYGEKARAVLAALLERYAESGVEEIEDLSTLKLEPISGMGTVSEILAAFGGRDHYLIAVRELEAALYRAA